MIKLRVLLLAAGFVALLGLLTWWGVEATRSFGPWTGGSMAIGGFLVLGAMGVGALTAALMWLAFYSDRKGYDEPPAIGSPPDAQPPPADGRTANARLPPRRR